MTVEVNVPTLGESVTEATVGKWTKSPGDAVAMDEALVELETDKVTIEVNAPAAGTLGAIAAQEGETVAVGALLATIQEGAAPAKAAAKPAAAPAAAPAPAKSGGGKTVDIVTPTMGESVSTGTLGTWAKQVGDAVAADEVLVEVETDKVTIEVNAPAAGRLASIDAQAGAEVGPGVKIGTIEAGAAPSQESTAAVPAAKPAPAAAPAPAAKPAAAPTPAAAPAPAPAASGSRPPLSPAVRKMVDDNDLDPARITGTGPDGRITKGDVQQAIANGSAKRQAAPAPAPTPAAAPRAVGPAPALTTENMFAPRPPRAPNDREERVKMSKLRQVIARRLKEAQNTAAMLTTWNEVDMGNVMALRSEYKEVFEKKHGARMGFMSFFVRAACIALKEWPAVNAEIYGDEIIYKNYYNVGVAVGTPQGLVVPVLKEADKMGFAEIEGGIADFGRRARDGKLGMDEMTGGTFTISNGGVFGSLNSMPILNVPQSAILGMHSIQKRPMVVNDEIEIRPMMHLALSYDHRIVDGREAVSFLVRIKQCIEDPQRILLNV